MSNLPPAIREQAAQVEALERAAAPAEPVVESAPAAAPATPAAPTPAVPAVSNEEFTKLQHQFQTLQGMWRAEKERNAENEERLRALEQPAAKPAEPASGFDPAVSDSDREAFGADLCAFVTNQVTTAVGHVLATTEARLAKIEAQMGETKTAVEATAEDTREVRWQKFLEQLDARVPKWGDIQNSAEGKKFLSMRVSGTKQVWNEVIQQAAREMDLEAVVEVFEAMFQVFPALRQAVVPTQPAAPANPLEAELAPGRGDGGSGPSPPPGKRVYKAKEYEAEMMRVVRMRQQRQDQQADALETELDLALREKRVVP